MQLRLGIDRVRTKRARGSLAEGVPRSGQLSRVIAAAVLLACGVAQADDRSEASTALFYEKRDGGKGGLSVVHPQASFGVDLGSYVSLDAGYSADAVSGATATIYQVDAVSSATTFSDLRQEGTATLGLHGRRSRLSVTGTFGTERDYLSRQLAADASIDLPGRNTTVDLAYSHSFDQVCDRDNRQAMPLERRALTGADKCEKQDLMFGKDDPTAMTLWHSLSIDTAQVTLTQNLTPTMNLQVAGFGQVLDGFQSNPYRRVRVNQSTPQEHIPNIRDRWSLTARLNRFLPKLHAAVHFSARFYDDTWDVIGGDVEMGYSQYVGDSMLINFHARVYQQKAAAFFKDAFFYQTEGPAREFYTGDRELSPVRDAMLGTKLTVMTIKGDKPVWGLFDRLNFNVKADILLLDQLAAPSSTTNFGGIGKEFIYGNSLLDAVIVQLGLLATY
jgi:hypothetical protein